MLADALSALPLDRDAQTPLFRQLYDGIKDAILGGRIGPGIRLPATRELAQLYGISRQTVLNAYEQLTAEGYLAGTVGRGTFVSAHLPDAGKARTPLRPAHPLSSRGQHFVSPQARLGDMPSPGQPLPFRTGMPGLDIFPFTTWARLSARRARRPEVQLGYSDAAGYLPLRELLAAYLRAGRGVDCTADQVIITSGSQQALYLIATLLLAPGERAWVEDPGYRGISALLHALEAQVCPLPVDQEGIDVAYGRKHYPGARLAYVTPSHQYPLGTAMTLARRLQLLDWAAQEKAWIVEDEYDSEYRYTGRPLASLQSMDRAGSVIYVGTLSKVMFPGLRMAYLVAPPALVEAFTRARAVMDRQMPILPQAVMADFMAEGHFQRHIRRCRDAYAERREVVLHALENELAAHLRVGPADTGLHMAAAFTRKRDDVALATMALERKLELRALSSYYAEPQRAPGGLVLGFTAAPSAELRRALAALRDLLDSA